MDESRSMAPDATIAWSKLEPIVALDG